MKGEVLNTELKTKGTLQEILLKSKIGVGPNAIMQLTYYLIDKYNIHLEVTQSSLVKLISHELKSIDLIMVIT